MTSAPLAILSNHLSTQNRRSGVWVDEITAGHDWVRHYAFDRVEDIPVLLEQCAKDGVGLIAVDGGDGTAGLIFSGLLNDGPYTTLPTLALLPSGKTNMTAQAWSLGGHRKKALADLLKRHRDGTIDAASHEQPIVTLHEESGVAPRHGAFFGGADIVDGILYCRRAIYPMGLPNVISHTAAVSVLLWRAMISGKDGDPVTASFEPQDPSGESGEDGRFFLVLATTMDRMLLGIRPHPLVGAGPLHYMSLRPGTRAVLSTVPHVLRRRVGPGSVRTVRRTQSVTLTSSGRYTLDGELYESRGGQPVVLSSHQSLRFVRW